MIKTHAQNNICSKQLLQSDRERERERAGQGGQARQARQARLDEDKTRQDRGQKITNLDTVYMLKKNIFPLKISCFRVLQTC